MSPDHSRASVERAGKTLSFKAPINGVHYSSGVKDGLQKHLQSWGTVQATNTDMKLVEPHCCEGKVKHSQRLFVLFC